MSKKFYLLSLMILLILSGCGSQKVSNESTTYVVSGIVKDDQGNGSKDVSVICSGDFSGKTLTDVNGTWNMVGLQGTVTIQPKKDGWTFVPDSVTVKKATEQIVFRGTQLNLPPQLNSIGDKEILECEELIFQVTATDLNGDKLTYSASGDLANFFDTNTRTFKWTPTYEDAGQYSMSFSVSDGDLIAHETIDITVIDYTPYEFKDSNLEIAIRKAINKPTGVITPEDIETLYVLDCSDTLYSEKISVLDGIENLTNLKELILDQNFVEDLNPLADLINLQKLNLRANNINNIAPISKLVSLEELNLGNNSIGEVDSLSSLIELRKLGLDQTEISDVAPLSNLSNMEELSISGNQIMDITPLANMKDLKIIDVSANRINDLTPLNDLTELQQIDLSSSQIKDISFLNDLTCLPTLQRLNLEGNQISDISNISNCSSLEYLNLDSNNITDISPLTGLTTLETLVLNFNQITDINSLANLVNLQGLFLQWNNIDDIAVVPHFVDLEELAICGNPISNITVLLELKLLKSLWLQDMSELDTSVGSAGYQVIQELEQRGVEIIRFF